MASVVFPFLFVERELDVAPVDIFLSDIGF
jgi:hypothetical protein